MEIRGEQAKLARGARRAREDPRLRRRGCASKVRDELERDAEEFGDARRSPIVERERGEGDGRDGADPDRAGDGRALREGLGARRQGARARSRRRCQYKSGDAFLHRGARGAATSSRSSSTRRAAPIRCRPTSCPRPAARASRSPATLAPPPGATFVGVMMGERRDLYLLATTDGYGFIVKLGDLQTRQRAGKAVMTVPDGARVLPPIRGHRPGEPAPGRRQRRRPPAGLPDQRPPAPAARQGREDPELLSAKGSRQSLAAFAVLQEGAHLLVHSGKRYLNLKPSEWKEFAGNRALKGNKLPRGYQNVGMLEGSAGRTRTRKTEGIPSSPLVPGVRGIGSGGTGRRGAPLDMKSKPGRG